MSDIPTIGTAPTPRGNVGTARTQRIKDLVAVAADNEGSWVSALLQDVGQAAGPEVYTQVGRHFSEVTFRGDTLYIRVYERKEV